MEINPDHVGILVFAKAPVPGKVKTRMQPDFSKNESATLQSKLINHTLKTALQFTHNVELWCHPSSSDEHFVNVRKQYGVALHTQTGIDLGEKMRRAMTEAIMRYKYIFLIGTDCPSLTTESFKVVQQYLQKSEVVIIPAEDGGYVLISCKDKAPDCFADIDWGTSKVLSQTLANLDKVNQSYSLPVSYTHLTLPTTSRV